MSVSAFGSVAPRDPRRPERGRTMERRHGFRVLCPSWRDGQQPPGRTGDQHARAAPDSELHGLHQHVDDSETTGAAALAREADTPRLRCADPADLGTRESVWPIRSRHEYAIGVAVIEMAPGDTTVGSTPIIGTAARGAFRAASAWWAGGGEATRIELMSELRACLETWDGAAPSSETWMATLHQASDEARRRVEQAEHMAAALRKGRLESQREAARRRLLLELGRFLVCVVDSVGDLNETFFQQMSRRDLATSLRLERCFAKLGHN